MPKKSIKKPEAETRLGRIVREENIIRGLVEDYYDIQHMRIEVENQLRSYSQEAPQSVELFIKTNVLGRLKDIEKDILKELNKYIKDEILWSQWLKGVRGVGPIIAAGLFAWIVDVEKFATISKLWMYAGYGVAEDGSAIRRKKGEKINWNPRLKTHMWKIGESFVKQKDSGYRKLYDTFRKEYEEKWQTPEDCHSPRCAKAKKCTDAHKFAAAKRKTVKVFLAHVHMKWRELKGLKIDHPFIMGREGHSHLIEVIEK